MPRVVDHEERRRQIATAVSDIAATRGLSDVSFREVAAQAGVSVSLVQHYFGDKANLLMTTLEIQSDHDDRLHHRTTRRRRTPIPTRSTCCASSPERSCRSTK